MSIAIRTCSTCGQVNPAFHDFCPICGGSLGDVPTKSATWTAAVRFPPLPEVVDPNQRRRRGRQVVESAGVGTMWLGFALIAIPIMITRHSYVTPILWCAGILAVAVGFWQMRRDPSTLAHAGIATTGLAVAVLALIGYKTVATQRAPDDAQRIAAVSVTATTRPDWTATSVPGAEVTMFRGNAAHTGELPGPGITGRPYRAWRFESTGELYSSPAVANGLVYVGTKSGFIYALDAVTGEERWKVALGDYIVRSSPAIVDGSVYIGSGYSIYSLDAMTGRQTWEAKTPFSGSSSPSVWNGSIYIASQSSSVYSFDATSGEQRWTFQTDGPIFSSPAISNEIVYVGTDSGKLLAMSAETGQVAWRFEAESAIYSSPAISDGLAFVTSRGGKVYAVELAGGRLRWSYDAGGDASPVVAGGVLYVASADGGLYALDAETGGDPKWLFPTGSPITTSPVIADGVIYLASGSTLYAVDAVTGFEVWRYSAGYTIETSPVVVNGFVYIGGQDGYLDAITGDGTVSQS